MPPESNTRSSFGELHAQGGKGKGLGSDNPLRQMEPVSDRAKPITLKVAVYDGGEPVTSIETVTFESRSDSIDERQKSVILTLQDRQFDKKTPYRLVLRDSETGIEQQSAEVTIDRAITDDFDF